jgi:hypothetical protein
LATEVLDQLAIGVDLPRDSSVAAVDNRAMQYFDPPLAPQDRVEDSLRIAAVALRFHGEEVCLAQDSVYSEPVDGVGG